MPNSADTSDLWQPPAGFIQVNSNLDGVTVYAPAPKETAAVAAPVTYTCPRCGAAAAYDIAAGGVACEHCGYSAPIKSPGAQPEAESEFTLETLEKSQHGWGVDRRELICGACGAVVTVPAGAISTTCPFCASNQVNLRDAAENQLRPGFVIPFKVEPQVIHKNTLEWLGKGWFHPDGLAASAGVDRFTGVYLPYWIFNAAISADWRAEVGYERQESYYDAGSKEWRTRTVIDWRPEDGEANLSIADFLEPGTAQLSQVILERIKAYALADLQVYTPDCLAGWQARTYDVLLPDAWEKGKAVMRDQAKDACMSQITSPHVRNFRMTADFADETWRYALLPVYVAAYRYEDRAFQVMANGQTGVVAGQKPVAWWKVWLAVAAALAPGLLLGLVSLPLMMLGGTGTCTLILGVILLIIGGIIAYQIYQSAVQAEAI